MILDIAMIVMLLIGFGILNWFVSWCDKQIHR